MSGMVRRCEMLRHTSGARIFFPFVSFPDDDDVVQNLDDTNPRFTGFFAFLAAVLPSHCSFV